MTKLIGVEFRFGFSGSPGGGLYETKLIPLEIEFPATLAYDHTRLVVSQTFHFDTGDDNGNGTIYLGKTLDENGLAPLPNESYYDTFRRALRCAKIG